MIPGADRSKELGQIGGLLGVQQRLHQRPPMLWRARVIARPHAGVAAQPASNHAPVSNRSLSFGGDRDRIQSSACGRKSRRLPRLRGSRPWPGPPEEDTVNPGGPGSWAAAGPLTGPKERETLTRPSPSMTAIGDEDDVLGRSLRVPEVRRAARIGRPTGRRPRQATHPRSPAISSEHTGTRT
jgi:hypothetical protein